MRLSELVEPLLSYRMCGSGDPDVLRIETDSRRVEPGTLFVAVPGYTLDGHDYVQQAVANGAVALLVQRELQGLRVPQVIVDNTQFASAMLADIFYRHPSTALTAIGVTGTNGKTTVTHIIRHVLEAAGHRAGLLGTVGAVIGDQSFPLPNTTPEAVAVQSYLQQMIAAGCSHAVMEVSSHALLERRVAGVAYHIGVFTNLSQDHLDYHGTMEAYARAKALLFARLGNRYGDSRADNSYAVINIDDAYAPYMLEATVAQTLTYGFSEQADVRATDVHLTHQGATLRILTRSTSFDVTTGLIGRFNVYNVLAAVAVALIEQVPVSLIVDALKTYPGVPGRCERVDLGQSFGILVDYAHTPDGLENVLNSVREFAQGDIITVVGCGGDRDRSKRPKMAAAALRLSDFTIFTSDNPRTEDPEQILDDMEAGVVRSTNPYVRISDRRVAIYEAISRAKDNDVVVIAGKGHEDYQIIGRTKVHFDDREEARAAVRMLASNQQV